MGRLDNLPEQNGANMSPDETQTAESLLRSVTQDLRSLQQDVLMQLNQDVNRLQAEKSRLINDIEKLQNQQQALQSQHEIDLSRQQLAQQQAWAKQLALVLANHLQTALNDRLNQTLGAYQSANPPQITGANMASDQSYRLASSLDDTVNRTFASLRHDINSYQSSLAQQLERMHTLGQQGEAILEVLVKRLSQQLQVEARQGGQYGGQQSGQYLEPSFPPREISPPTNMALPLPENFSLGNTRPAIPPSASTSPTPSAAFNPPASSSSWMDSLIPNRPQLEEVDEAIDPDDEEVAAEAAPIRPSRTRRISNLKLGLGFVFLSTLVISLHYVTVGIIGNASQLFGQQAIGGYLSLNTFSNSALLLWIRMLVVVPIMVWLSTYLYPPTLREVRTLSRSQDRRALIGIVVSGVFLFLSQVFLYIAIGQTGPGVAVTLLFMYPIGSLVFGFLLFAEKLSLKRLGIILGILVGTGLAVYPLLSIDNPPTGGIIAGIISAVTFTLYLIAMQLGARKVHPIPVSLLQFATMFVLSSISLIVFGLSGKPTSWTSLLISGGLLGLFTVGSYTLNHYGIRALGAARSAIIAASTPVITALLAFFLVPGTLTTLNFVQILGVLLVTLSGTALSLERLMLHNKAIRQAKQREQELAS